MNLTRAKNKNDLKLLIFPNEILTKQAKFIKNPLSTEIQKLIPQMFQIMKKEIGTGLAAPQVGKSLQLAIIEFKSKKFTLINPEIINKSSEKIVFPEGCLSFPKQEFPIIRYDKITVRYTDEFGKKCKLKTDGVLAVIFQHEIDHLNGILMSDRFKEQKPIREKYNISNKV